MAPPKSRGSLLVNFTGKFTNILGIISKFTNILVNLLVILVKILVNLLVKLTKSGLGTTLLGLPLPPSSPAGAATTPQEGTCQTTDLGCLSWANQEEPLADYRNPVRGSRRAFSPTFRTFLGDILVIVEFYSQLTTCITYMFFFQMMSSGGIR